MADCFGEASFKTSDLTQITSTPEVRSRCYLPKMNLETIPKTFSNLCKVRLTSLVTFTSLGGYLLAIGPMDPTLICSTMAGVFMCSCSANCMNHFLDAPFDSQMTRTRGRVLPMCLLKPEVSVHLSFLFGICGSSLLYYYANPLACALGLANIILYCCFYTPMKRMSLYNTHVGSLVGAIPPLIGWAAATGTLDFGSLLLALILYNWQFVHFNALSWNLRDDYCRAGFQMMAVLDAKKLRRSTLMHSIILFLTCMLSPSSALPKIPFIASTLWINLITIYYSIQFYLLPSYQNSKKLFWVSLVQITVIISSITGLYLYEKYKNKITPINPNVLKLE